MKTMTLPLAYCGLVCDTCPIHLATVESDPEKRRQMRTDIARHCTENYAMKMLPEDVTECDGCRSGGRLFSGCSGCEIRSCAAGRNLESCALCTDYGCGRLQKLFAQDPDAWVRLEQLRLTS